MKQNLKLMDLSQNYALSFLSPEKVSNAIANCDRCRRLRGIMKVALCATFPKKIRL